MIQLKPGDVILRPKYDWVSPDFKRYPVRRLVGFQAAIVVRLVGDRVKWRAGLRGLDGAEFIGTSDRGECIAIAAFENLSATATDEKYATPPMAGAVAVA